MIKYIHKLCLALFLETFSAEARRVCFNAQRLPKLVFKISFFKVLKHLTLLKSILTNQCTYALHSNSTLMINVNRKTKKTWDGIIMIYRT